jgi:hypothetical protein
MEGIDQRRLSASLAARWTTAVLSKRRPPHRLGRCHIDSAVSIGTPVTLFPTAVPAGGVGTGAAPDYSVSADGQRFLMKPPSDGRWAPTMIVLLDWTSDVKQ